MADTVLLARERKTNPVRDTKGEACTVSAPSFLLGNGTIKEKKNQDEVVCVDRVSDKRVLRVIIDKSGAFNTSGERSKIDRERNPIGVTPGKDGNDRQEGS